MADGLMCSLSLTDVGHGVRGYLSTCHPVTARGGVTSGLAEHGFGKCLAVGGGHKLVTMMIKERSDRGAIACVRLNHGLSKCVHNLFSAPCRRGSGVHPPICLLFPTRLTLKSCSWRTHQPLSPPRRARTWSVTIFQSSRSRFSTQINPIWFTDGN